MEAVKGKEEEEPKAARAKETARAKVARALDFRANATTVELLATARITVLG